MKKSLKFILIALMSLMILFGMTQTVSFAKIDPGFVANMDGNEANTTEISKIGGTVVNWIWAISIVVAVIVLMITGLKFILGSTQEKAEYKKSLIPLVVGILLLVFATTIVKIIFSIGGNS